MHSFKHTTTCSKPTIKSFIPISVLHQLASLLVMAMKNMIVSSSAAVLVMMLLFVNVSEAVISCSDVDMKAASCVNYASGKAPTPAAACCSGLLALANSVKSVDDKKTICRCLKTAVKSFSGVQDRFLSQIPTACKIKVSFPVSLNTNCETIH